MTFDFDFGTFFCHSNDAARFDGDASDRRGRAADRGGGEWHRGHRLVSSLVSPHAWPVHRPGVAAGPLPSVALA